MTDLSSKTLLILGAGRGQIGLYKAAHELGIKTIAGTMLENPPICLPLADQVCEMDIMNPDEVEAKTKHLHFDGVATCCLDKGLRALGRLVDRYNLIGFSETSADICNNKLLMKQKFREHNVNSAPFIELFSEKEIDSCIEKLGGYPVIIKATDLAGSRGIYKAADREEAINGFRSAITETKQNYLIIEKYITGNEFGAQAFVQNGEVLFVLPHGDILYHAKTDVPIGHFVPYTLDANQLNEIKKTSIAAIHALGLNNCAVNLDFIEKDGKIYVLELSGRIGANGLPEMVSAYFNINYYKMVILASLGLNVEDEWSKRKVDGAVISRMLFSTHQDGKLKEFSYSKSQPDSVVDMQLFAKPGSIVHKFENSSHCIGQFTVKAPALDEAKKCMEEVLQNMNILLE